MDSGNNRRSFLKHLLSIMAFCTGVILALILLRKMRYRKSGIITAMPCLRHHLINPGPS